MGVSIEKWDAATAAYSLRNRRRLRIAAIVIAGILVLSVLGDHLRGQNPFGDDWNSFDGRKFQVVEVIDGQSITVRSPLSEEVNTLRLPGIKSFARPWDKNRFDELDAEFAGRIVTLHLGTTKTRDDNGRLLADAVLDDGKSLAAEFAGEGLSLVDRGSSSMFLSSIERAEAQARRKGLGMWADK